MLYRSVRTCPFSSRATEAYRAVAQNVYRAMPNSNFLGIRFTVLRLLRKSSFGPQGRNAWQYPRSEGLCAGGIPLAPYGQLYAPNCLKW
jgi:hypothetical protein